MKNDELTLLRNRISWAPLVQEGTTLITHRLDCSHPQHWVFRTSPSYRTAFQLLLLAGVCLTGNSIFSGSDDNAYLVPGGMGAFFLLAGLFLLWNGSLRANFDFRRKYYWKDRRKPRSGNMDNLRDNLPLKKIAALQIVKKFCRGNNRYTYCCYELNLVTSDGNRLNVTNHGGRTAIEEDALKLATRLNVPVWGLEDETLSGEQRKERKKAKLLYLLIGGIFLSIGIATLWFLFFVPLRQHSASRHWVKVPATVILSERLRSHSGSKGRNVYRTVILYEYQYNGRTHRSDRYALTQVENSSKSSTAEMRRPPAGTRISCYVNPDDPAQALVDRTLPPFFYLTHGCFPLSFLGLGLLAVIAGIRKR